MGLAIIVRRYGRAADTRIKPLLPITCENRGRSSPSRVRVVPHRISHVHLSFRESCDTCPRLGGCLSAATSPQVADCSLNQRVNMTDEGLVRVKCVEGSAGIVGGGILATHDPILVADRGGCRTRPRACTTGGAAQRPRYLSAHRRRPLDAGSGL